MMAIACVEKGCSEIATVNVYWPTHPDKPIALCKKHTERAESVAKNLGLTVTKTQIPVSESLPGPATLRDAITTVERILSEVAQREGFHAVRVVIPDDVPNLVERWTVAKDAACGDNPQKQYVADTILLGMLLAHAGVGVSVGATSIDDIDDVFKRALSETLAN
jgi:hypothetical protein